MKYRANDMDRTQCSSRSVISFGRFKIAGYLSGFIHVFLSHFLWALKYSRLHRHREELCFLKQLWQILDTPNIPKHPKQLLDLVRVTLVESTPLNCGI